MNRLHGVNWKYLHRLAMAAGIAIVAQAAVSAQTSEDKGQAGSGTSSKASPKIPDTKGSPQAKPTPKPEIPKPLALSVTTDKKTYVVGTAIKMTLTAKNTTMQAMNLNFNSGQKYDFTLREGVKPDGKIVWHWAQGHMFAQMITAAKLEPGKTLTYTETYAPTPDSLKAGTYTLEAKLATFGERPIAVTQVVIK